MPRLISFLIFILLGTGVMGAVHYYFWRRIVCRLALPRASHRALSLVVFALFVNLPLSLALSRVVPRAVGSVWLPPSLSWLGVAWLLLVSLAFTDLVSAVTWLWHRAVLGPVDHGRRNTLSRLFGLAATMIAGGSSTVALIEGATFELKRVGIKLPRLSKKLDGFKIVQITDVHVGPTIGRAFIEQVVAQVNQLDADIVAITGDLVDGSVDDLAETVAPLAKLKSRHGTFFVTGNHEYYSGAVDWCAHLPQLGIRVLRNERVAIQHNGSTLQLAGVDDFHAKRFGDGHGANLRRAMVGRDSAQPVVLLAHQPRAAFEASEHDVDLQLSGHTHGGQLWPFNFLVRLQQPVVSGLAKVGNTQVYVSNGTGYWGPPMRLGAPAEITQLVLQSVV